MPERDLGDTLILDVVGEVEMVAFGASSVSYTHLTLPTI